MALLLLQLLLLLLLHLRHHRTAGGEVASEFLYPNFSASSINYIDKGDVFLSSPSSAFSAILSSESPQSPFVFSILHRPTSTVVWSANFASPAPYTSVLSLSPAGLSISLSNGTLLWFTPPLPRPIAALRLLDSGNLLLLDDLNASLWQSFDHPTDTLLSSQRLPVAASLSTPAGDYRLLITADDAVLLWVNGGDQQYWRLSADPRSVKHLGAGTLPAAAFMAANGSGLYLFSAAGGASYALHLPTANLRFVRLESGGRFRIMSYSGDDESTPKEEFVAPIGACDLPLPCRALEVCTPQSKGVACNCPPSFPPSAAGGCSPADSSVPPSPSNCGAEQPSYRSLGTGADYFANKFSNPATSGGNVSSCRSLCSENCSCLAFFYQKSSKSCFLVNNQLGSLLPPAKQGAFDSSEAYIKIPAQSQPEYSRRRTPKLIPILLPSLTLLLALLLLALLYRRRANRKPSTSRSSAGDAFISDDEIPLPTLPTRFTYADLAAATNGFRTRIGSGGFGEVFRGDLPDKTPVAVKRINNANASGIRGKKKEFVTEIAVIGSIHHANLLRLRGFCAEGHRRRLLVYDYMSRGSLDRSLFFSPASSSSVPPLEWKERMSIAVGVARGLAYLHSGCERKIVHCDVKPENILLHSSGGAKISDFGMAKLMGGDQSSGMLFTTMRGTRGYLAPEWLTNSAITDKADVYSFGLVLLEIVRGRRNWEAVAEGWSVGVGVGSEGGYFPMVALEMHEKGRYLELADPRLEGRVREEEVGRAVRVGLCCLHEEAVMRPAMEGVAAMLEGTVEAGRPRAEALGFLRAYGRGFVCSGDGESGKEEISRSSGGSNSSCSVMGYSYSYLSSQEVSGPR